MNTYAVTPIVNRRIRNFQQGGRECFLVPETVGHTAKWSGHTEVREMDGHFTVFTPGAVQTALGCWDKWKKSPWR